MPQSQGIRELGRELVFVSLYIYDVAETPLPELLSFRWFDSIQEFGNEDNNIIPIPEAQKNDVYSFSRELLNGTVSCLKRIDRIIQDHLVKWNFNRLHAIDKAILRVSIYSLIYRFDIPAEVTISEANELSDKYCDEKTSAYINGILHKVKQEFRRNFLLKLKIRKK